MTQPRPRPRSLQEMREIAAPLFSREALQRGLALKLRPSDVVITPYGKSGTTWTQQIVHSLRTGGDMDFDDISRVVPWIETSATLGIELDAEQRANPRAFKSHLGADKIPKGGRYINVVRNPADVIVSLYKFQEGWFFEPGTIELDEFAQAHMQHTDAYFKHLLGWWARRNDPDVLFLAYEKMLKDPRATIARIARFIEVPADDALLDLAETNSSIEFMLKHKDRFDDVLMRKASEEICGLPSGSDSSKVREGKSGGGKRLNSASLAVIKEQWHKHITAELGFEDYKELLGTLPE